MEQRHHPRFDTCELALCRIPATPLAVEIINLSRGGCAVRVSSDVTRAIGATVLLTLSDGIELSGEIAWIRHPRLGIKFHHQLDTETVLRLAGAEKSYEHEGGAVPIPIDLESTNLSQRANSLRRI